MTTPLDFEYDFFSGHELAFLARLGAALTAGILIGVERESRNKNAPTRAEAASVHPLAVGY